jgi:polysaccharide biosynthesis/export protein
MKTRTDFFLKSVIAVLILLIMLLLMSSCSKNVLYTHNSGSGSNAAAAVKVDEGRESKILQPDDKITISVWEHDELSIGSVHTVYSVAEESGKWVMLDAEGNVTLPQIGVIKLGGLTIAEASQQIKKEYSKNIQNPIVTIKVLNNQVTVLGEVQRPGIYVFSSDNIRLTDVLGKSSGLTDYAKTKQIKIIRGKESIKIDLTNIAFNETRVLPGDVIYIPPTGGKKFDRIASKLIPIASLLTALALVYNVSQNN